MVSPFTTPSQPYSFRAQVAALKQSGNRQPPSTLVYCPSKKETEAVCDYLRSHGINADYYHAGRSPHERESVRTTYLNIYMY